MSSREPVLLPNLSVQQLEYLVAAADHPTRAAAAQNLGVTASALTQGLTELERRVGLPLFERQGRSTVLRRQADQVLAHARRVVAETRDLARWAEAQKSGSTGQIRLGAIDAVAVHHKAEAIRRFHQDSPEVDLHLTVAPSGPLLEALQSGDLDLVLCVDPTPAPPGIVTTLLFEEPLMVYAPPGAKQHPILSWGPWVSFPAGSHTRSVIAAALAAEGISYEVVAESNQPEVLREMVRLGLGWAVLPPVQAESGVEPLTPVRRLPIAKRKLVIARRVAAPTDPATEALITALENSA